MIEIGIFRRTVNFVVPGKSFSECGFSECVPKIVYRQGLYPYRVKPSLLAREARIYTVCTVPFFNRS